ncbi:MAG TPA: FAD:protein FMN transferase, partial [Saprospiraceae bacterium]|nr:FAD:protein FMN transferase [Saprospiraceae bacterium]
MRLTGWIWILITGLCSQSGSAQTKGAWHRYEFTHPQMGTVFRLIFYAKTDSVTAAVWAKDVFNAVDSLNAIMSDYLPESELNRLSRQSGTGVSVAVSADLWQILHLSGQFSAKSRGAFDVTIGPLTRLWRRARNLKEVPDSADIGKALAAVGYQYL